MTMENFITGHLLEQDVDVYCGGDDKFEGKIVGCADGVITLETDNKVYTHIAIQKIIAIWRKADSDRVAIKPLGKGKTKK